MDTIDSSKFKISILQATIFTPDHDFTTSQVMSKFYPKITDVFDADPEVVPDVVGFPLEVPRITIKNKLKSFRLEIAPVRINFFGRAIKEDSDQLDDFFKKAINLFCQFYDIIECRIGRLAAVRTVYLQHDNPGIFLARHFCKDIWDEAPLNRPENFELHAHKVYNFEDIFRVNSWARSKTGHLTTKEKKSRILLFEQDINTLAEEAGKKSFNTDGVKKFFSAVTSEFQNILNLYFPLSTRE